MQTICVFLLSSFSVFMMILILIQRGKGGGLAGAFGGMGGQSAFGTKAGDVFTKTTVVIAIIWFALSIMTIRYLKWENGGSSFGGFGSGAASQTIEGTGTPASTASEGSAESTAPTSTAPATSAPAAPEKP
jgi:preprotein translocase subunit SecG